MNPEKSQHLETTTNDGIEQKISIKRVNNMPYEIKYLETVDWKLCRMCPDQTYDPKNHKNSDNLALSKTKLHRRFFGFYEKKKF